MMKSAQSDKERVIYEAVRKMLEQGRTPANMTISEIAAQANIGKGTVYEYFATKEELLSRAIAFSLRQEFEEMRRELEEHTGFKSRFYAMLNLVEHYRAKSVSLMRLFLPDVHLQELIAADDEDALEFHAIVLSALDSMLALGRDEGLIQAEIDGYSRLVFFSIICGFIAYHCGPHHQDVPQSKDYAYKALIKALN